MRSSPGLGRVATCAQGRGIGKSLLALEAGARASRYLRSRPRLRLVLLALEARARARRRLRSRPRLERVVACARGLGSGESLLALEAWAQASCYLRSRTWLERGVDCLFRGETNVCGSDSFLCHFLSSCLGYPILWYPTNKYRIRKRTD